MTVALHKSLSESIYIIYITMVGVLGGLILVDLFKTPIIESDIGMVLVMWVIGIVNQG